MSGITTPSPTPPPPPSTSHTTAHHPPSINIPIPRSTIKSSSQQLHPQYPAPPAKHQRRPVPTSPIPPCPYLYPSHPSPSPTSHPDSRTNTHTHTHTIYVRDGWEVYKRSPYTLPASPGSDPGWCPRAGRERVLCVFLSCLASFTHSPTVGRLDKSSVVSPASHPDKACVVCLPTYHEA